MCCIQVKTSARVGRGKIVVWSVKYQFQPEFYYFQEIQAANVIKKKTSMPPNSGLSTKSHIQQKGYMFCHIFRFYNSKGYHLLASLLLLLTPLEVCAGETTPVNTAGEGISSSSLVSSDLHLGPPLVSRCTVEGSFSSWLFK